MQRHGAWLYGVCVDIMVFLRVTKIPGPPVVDSRLCRQAGRQAVAVIWLRHAIPDV